MCKFVCVGVFVSEYEFHGVVGDMGKERLNTLVFTGQEIAERGVPGVLPA